jgi:Rps23 Pro-64 3,4-dihydroxylase Tpa1-like proline 4-hydroxylase
MITASAQVLDFSAFSVFSKPFPYGVSPRAFKNEISLDVLDWLETEAPWKLVEKDFYEQYEFSFVDARLPSKLAFLKAEAFFDALRAEVQRLLRVSLRNHIDATAHMLVPGQRIRIHNDFLPGGETHRLLIQLNRRWEHDNGGFLLFFNSPDPKDVHKIFPPAHNSAVAFSISPDSNHAVTLIHGSVRFTLVYSFYEER